MKKSNIYLLLGLLLLVCALLFIWRAVFGPLAGFPWDLSITYTIYGVYLAVTGGSLLLSLFFQLKKEGRLIVPKIVLTGICLCMIGILACFLVYLIVSLP